MHGTIDALIGPKDAERVLIALTLAAGCFFHFLSIDSLPMGFYVDESSIGYNAHLIATTGADEHGVRWPLFFEAFGEYKNPLYIYLLAALYSLLGYSEWTTRCLSVLCWLVGAACLFELSWSLFLDNMTRLYVAITLAFTPWLFALSRISFEVISLFPLLSLHLLGLYRGFERNSRTWSVISGVALGLCLYAYSTFRLLTPVYCVTVILCFRAPRFRPPLVAFILSASVVAIPFTLYAFRHLDTLVIRFDRHFDSLTYMNDPTLTAFEKLKEFVTLYIGYFSLTFLGLSGDPNLRHHSGFGGELLAGTLVILIISAVRTIRHRDDPFRTYLLVGLLVSPLAAALTVDPLHSLRSFSMSVFAAILSAYGLAYLSRPAARVLVALTALCAGLYVFHYFVLFPPESAIAFENYGFEASLRDALASAPKRVVLSSQGNVPYINLLFFGTLEHTSVPLVVGTRDDLRPGDVFISYDWSSSRNGFYRVDRSLLDLKLTR